ncbi:MAG: DNA polymerase III subunit delta' [Chloroflexi bacterium]|nr:DNA polymerase III subunit delta' [Chloroflexota bacterium]
MWQLIGHKAAVSLLQNGLSLGTLAHAYLLVGPPRVGKMTLALELARALNCRENEPPCGRCDSCRKIASGLHADVQVIALALDEKTGKPRTEIGIDQVREMQHAASLPPFEGDSRVFIINGAESLSLEAANCLLKTLEEPVGHTVFILLATSEGQLPETVMSRCQRLKLHPLAVTEVESALVERWDVEPGQARLLARLSHGCPGWAIAAAADDSLLTQRQEGLDRLFSVMDADCEERLACAAEMAGQFSQDRGRVYQALELWLDCWRDLLLVKAGKPEMVRNIDHAETLASIAGGWGLSQVRNFIGDILAAGEQLRQNANPRLVLDVLMLDIPGKERAGGGSLAA